MNCIPLHNGLVTSTHRLYVMTPAVQPQWLSTVSPNIIPRSCEWCFKVCYRLLHNETKRVINKLETVIWTTSPPTPSPIYRDVSTIWAYWLRRGQVHSLHPKKFPSFCIPPYNPFDGPIPPCYPFTVNYPFVFPKINP